MPEYTIVAGPNGAGKSSFSGLIASPGSLIFDADKVKFLKEKQWPDIPIDSIEIMITTEYWEVEDTAIAQNINLTVESNLRNDFLIKRSVYFKDKGFTANLVFMLLPDVQASIDRVNLRVYKKGHFVDNESIKFNFEESLRMLKQHFDKFDSLIIMDSSLDNNLTIPNTLLILNNNTVSFIDSNAPSWAKPTLDEIVTKLSTN